MNNSSGFKRSKKEGRKKREKIIIFKENSGGSIERKELKRHEKCIKKMKIKPEKKYKRKNPFLHG